MNVVSEMNYSKINNFNDISADFKYSTCSIENKDKGENNEGNEGDNEDNNTSVDPQEQNNTSANSEEQESST